MGGLQEVFQVAHGEDVGPVPFWVYILLAIPAPTIFLLTYSGSWGEAGNNYRDGSNAPPGSTPPEVWSMKDSDH